MDGRSCADIDECKENPRICNGGKCTNTPGSYLCSCQGGLTTSSDGITCEDIDECTTPGMCLNGECDNTLGSFKCRKVLSIEKCYLKFISGSFLKKFCYLYIIPLIPISYLLLPIYNKVLISTNLSTKSTYLSYTSNNELLPLMDSPDTFFSKTQFKSIKYFNKS